MHTSMKRILAALALSGTLLLLAPPAGASEVVVQLQSGGRVQGQLILRAPTRVMVLTRHGIVTVRSEDIRAITAAAGEPTVRDEVAARRAQVDPASADSLWELGVFCAEQGRAREAREAFTLALEIDPDHEAARAELGYVRFGGVWRTAEEVAAETSARIVRLPDGSYGPPPGAEPAAGEPTASGTAPVPAPSAGGSASATGRARPSPQEDMAFYDDHETVGAWDPPNQRFETPHYVLVSNLKRTTLERYATMLELYHARFRQVFRNLMPRSEAAKSEVIIFPTQQEFMSGTGMPQQVGGFYNPGNKRVVTYHGRFGQTGTTRNVLVHEATHQFEDIVLQNGFTNAPVWILEGLAVLFESAFYDGEEVQIGTIPLDRLRGLKRAIQAGQAIPLAEMIRTPQPQFTGMYYAHAWGLIYMMIYYDQSERLQRQNREVFSRLFVQAQQRAVTPEDVEQIFGGREQFEQFEATWRQWILDLPEDYDPNRNG